MVYNLSFINYAGGQEQRLARKLEMWATKVNQTVEFEGRVKLISKRKELKLLPKWSVTLLGNHIHLGEIVNFMR